MDGVYDVPVESTKVDEVASSGSRTISGSNAQDDTSSRCKIF